jgi:hypothetical protein
MKTKSLILFLVLSACGAKPDSPADTKPASEASAAMGDCTKEAAQMRSLNGETLAQVARMFMTIANQNQNTDVQALAECLDRNLTISCQQNQPCLIEGK